MAEYSPMMRQYFEIKEKNKDTILFFRVGDFYEMFFEDAVLASKELEIALTGKECGKEERAPMCGVPYHSAEAYIARLLEKGHKVAVCEQTQDAAIAKGIIERQVVRVVTPGTVIESSMLPDDRNNYIASIFINEQETGICFADISTGNAFVTCLQGQNMHRQTISELARHQPSEVLFNSQILLHKAITDYIKQNLNCSAELLDDEVFEENAVKERLQKHFNTKEGAKNLPDGLPQQKALGALIAYLQETQIKGVQRLRVVQQYSAQQYMHLPLSTLANLELCETMRTREKKGSLLWVIDKTSTAMGKRLLRNWLKQPLVDKAAINARLNAVEELFCGNVQRLELAAALACVFDMERLLTRALYGNISPRELAALAATCKKLPEIKALLQGFKSPQMQTLFSEIDPLQDVQESIEKALADELPAKITDGDVIRTGYSPQVDELRSIMRGGKGMLAGVEAKMKEETGIRTLKIGYNRVFGYYIEVSKNFAGQVPQNFVRKQTLAGAERYITEELKTLENRILGAAERLQMTEKELFAELMQEVAEQIERVQKTAAALAQLDVFCALAQVAVANDYCRPEVDDGDALNIEDGRHPVVEQMSLGSLFVPNSTAMDCGENRMQIITGPNMAGKSTYMRQTALIVIMAQMGSFVPAAKCQLGMCDAVFTRVGASDDLAQGRSTFMVEMNEVAEILQSATPKSLVILDEIGRGTSTFDGMSIAQAVVEYMLEEENGCACKTLFATHYHELTELEKTLNGVKNYNVAVKKRGDDITFLRRIVRGAADDSYGIQVAKLAGLPEKIVERSKQVLKQLEKSSSAKNAVKQLDFEAATNLQSFDAPAELMEKLMQIDPETLTPLEGLKLVYQLKKLLE